MWFALGFFTLAGFGLLTARLRFHRLWRGTAHTAGPIRYESSVESQRGRAVALLLGVAAPAGLTFRLKREGLIDRLFKAVGLTVEYQTGDRVFDRRMYIVSDDWPLLRWLALDEDLRGHVVQLSHGAHAQGLRFEYLECRRGKVWVRFSIAEHRTPREVTVPEDLVKQLDALSQRLQACASARTVESRDPFVLRAALLLSVSTALAVNGAIHLFRIIAQPLPATLELAKLYYFGFLAGSALLALLVAATFVLLGRTARAHLVLIEIVLVGSFGAYSSAGVALRDANIDLDVSPAAAYGVNITGQHISRSSRGALTYYVTVEDWRRPGQSVKLRISEDLYYQLTRKQKARIAQRAGSLGIAWIQNISPCGAQCP